MAEYLTLLCFLGLLFRIAWVDYRTMKIPDRLILLLAAVGILSVFTMPQTGILTRIGGAFAVSLPMFLLALARPGGFGGGDIKLLAAGGLFLGVRLSVISFFFAVFAAGLCGLFLLLFRKKGKKYRFALGPFLCAGMALGYFWERTGVR